MNPNAADKVQETHAEESAQMLGPKQAANLEKYPVSYPDGTRYPEPDCMPMTPIETKPSVQGWQGGESMETAQVQEDEGPGLRARSVKRERSDSLSPLMCPSKRGQAALPPTL